jgi:hypothetical protein
VDSDCIEGWICAMGTETQCDDAVDSAARPAPCPEGQTCPEPAPEPELIAPPECDTTPVSYCSPPYIQPCEEAADCGPGFDCTQETRSRCSGGGSAGDSGSGSAGDSGGDADPSDPAEPPAGFAPPQEDPPAEDVAPPDSTCVEETTENFYCELIETPCTTDQDCEDGLISQPSPTMTTTK